MGSGVKFLDIVEDSLFGTLQRTGGFHFERNGCGSEQQRIRDGNAHHAFGKISAEGGIAASGAAGQIACLDRAGIIVLAVIDQHFAVVRDQDLLGAPFIKLLGGGAAVGQTGEDLGFCRIGFEKIEIGKAHLLKSGTKIAVLSIGFIGNNVDLALDKVSNSDEIAHYDFGFVKPLDEKLLHEIFSSFETIITIEDGAIKGGFGSAVIEFASENSYKNSIKTLGIPDNFIEHGTVDELQQICKIDVKSLEKLFSTI